MPSATNAPAVAGDDTETDRSAISADSNEKVWERAWDVNELRQSAKVWSLAADAGLLRHLQQFCNSLTLQAHESTKNINQLVHDTHMTDAKLGNVAGKFLTFSDSQFIENRVYDEEINDSTPTDESRTESSDDANSRVNAVPKLTEAIQHGLKVLDEAFEILDANAANSDFESDQDSDSENNRFANGVSQGIYEPKDPYIARPLPHLIGSRGFHEQDDVGVADLPSEDEAHNDQGSISESDEEEVTGPAVDSSVTSSDYESDVESSDSDQDSRVGQKSAQGFHKAHASSSESDRDLFADQSDSNSIVSSDNEQKTQIKVKRKLNDKKPQKDEEEDFIFKGEENDDDHGEGLFANSAELFGAGTNLFSDETKDRGIFSEAEQGSIEEMSSDSEKASIDEEVIDTKRKYGGVSLFGGAIAKDFFNKKEDKEKTDDGEDTASQQALDRSSGNNLGLFDDSEEDDQDLFSNKPPPVLKHKAPSTVSSGSFKNENKTLFDSGSESESDMLVPTSIKKPAKTATKSSDIFGSSSDDDLFVVSSSLKSGKKSALSYEGERSIGRAPSDVSTADSFKPNTVFSDKGVFAKTSSSTTAADAKKDELFADDSDDDDLFSSGLTTDLTMKRSTISVFDADDNLDFKNSSAQAKPETSDNLFDSHTPDRSSSQVLVGNEKSLPKKKLVGAVPIMFTGSDAGAELAAAISKRRADSDLSSSSSGSGMGIANSSEGDPKKHLSTATLEAEEFMDITTKPLESSKSNYGPTPSFQKMPPPKYLSKPISVLSAGLSIDPTALLPGATLKADPVLTTEVSFDSSLKVKTLENVTRTRARGQPNRRLPSRYGKSRRTASADAWETKSPSLKNMQASAVENIQAQTSGKPDIALSHGDPLPGDGDASGKDFFTSKEPKECALDAEIFSDTLLDGGSSNIAAKSNLASNDPLVSSAKQSRDKHVTIFDDSDTDDIFGTDLTEKKESGISKAEDDLFSDHDDLFGDNLVSMKSKTKLDTNNDKGSLEKDIFSEPAKPSASKSKKTKVKQPAKSKKPKSIFDDDDDDEIDNIFSSTASKKKKQPTKTGAVSKKKSEKTKSEKVTNIFDDPLNI